MEESFGEETFCIITDFFIVIKRAVFGSVTKMFEACSQSVKLLAIARVISSFANTFQ